MGIFTGITPLALLQCWTLPMGLNFAELEEDFGRERGKGMEQKEKTQIGSICETAVWGQIALKMRF